MRTRLVFATALLLGSTACSEDEQTLACDEAFERLNEEQQQLIEELGSEAPILDFNFPAECFGE